MNEKDGTWHGWLYGRRSPAVAWVLAIVQVIVCALSYRRAEYGFAVFWALSAGYNISLAQHGHSEDQ